MLFSMNRRPCPRVVRDNRPQANPYAVSWEIARERLLVGATSLMNGWIYPPMSMYTYDDDVLVGSTIYTLSDLNTTVMLC